MNGYIVFASVPFGIPAFDNANTETMRINFLTHYLFPPSDGILFFFNCYSYVARTFQNFESLSTGTRMNTFHGRTLIYCTVGYDQVIHPEPEMGNEPQL